MSYADVSHRCVVNRCMDMFHGHFVLCCIDILSHVLLTCRQCFIGVLFMSTKLLNVVVFENSVEVCMRGHVSEMLTH